MLLLISLVTTQQSNLLKSKEETLGADPFPSLEMGNGATMAHAGDVVL